MYPTSAKPASIMCDTPNGDYMQLGWDGLGMLVAVSETVGGGTALHAYRYAPSGLRVRAAGGSRARDSRFAYTTGGALLSMQEAITKFGPGAQTDIIYANGAAISEIDDQGNVFELHSDHLGSPRYITNGNPGDPDEGHIIGEQAFGPYGEAMEGTFSTPGGSLTLPWGYRPVTGYTGHLNEDPTGLIYMKGRYYSPRWHRFINSDRGADPYSLNQTAYVGGSPFEATDPMGLSAKVQAQYKWHAWPEDLAALGAGGDWSRDHLEVWDEIWLSPWRAMQEKAKNDADDNKANLESATEEASEPLPQYKLEDGDRILSMEKAKRVMDVSPPWLFKFLYAIGIVRHIAYIVTAERTLEDGTIKEFETVFHANKNGKKFECEAMIGDPLKDSYVRMGSKINIDRKLTGADLYTERDAWNTIRNGKPPIYILPDFWYKEGQRASNCYGFYKYMYNKLELNQYPRIR